MHGRYFHRAMAAYPGGSKIAQNRYPRYLEKEEVGKVSTS
jgi:hypothetical protein